VRVIALAAVALALAAPAAAAGSAGIAPMETSPFTVRGWAFHTRERLTLTVYATGTFVRTVTASAAGRFQAVVPDVQLARCSSYALRAIGASGSRAFFKLPPMMCAPL